VFQNLVDNAIKYARPATAVKVAAKPASPGRIAVAVSDEGDGIPAVHLPRLTERFYRVDTARSRQLGGTGLGLDIQSTPGRGSTFTVTLPAA
jgi:two-component system, OmpR family, phosphate regulon sensor histidine kinase PhoR